MGDRLRIDAERVVILRGVCPRAARTDPASVNHPRDADVLDVGVRPGDLRGDVDAVHQPADELILAHRLRVALPRDVAGRGRHRRCQRRQVEVEVLTSVEIAVLHLLAAARDHAVRGREAPDRHAQLGRRRLQHQLERLGGRGPGHGRAGRDRAAAAAAADRVQPGLRMRVHHHRHIGDVQLLSDQHQDAGGGSAELGLAVGDDHGVRRRDRQPAIDLRQSRVTEGEEVVRIALPERRVPGRAHCGARSIREREAGDHGACCP